MSIDINLLKAIHDELNDYCPDITSGACAVMDNEDNVLWPKETSDLLYHLCNKFSTSIKRDIGISTDILFGYSDNLVWSKFSNDPRLFIIAEKESISQLSFKAISKNLSKTVDMEHDIKSIGNYNNFFSDLNESKKIAISGNDGPQAILNTCWSFIEKNNVLKNLNINAKGMAIYLHEQNTSEEISGSQPSDSYREIYVRKAFALKSPDRKIPKSIKINMPFPDKSFEQYIDDSNFAYIVPFASPKGMLSLFMDDDASLKSLTSSHEVMLDAYFNVIIIKLFPSITSIRIAREFAVELALNLFNSVATTGILLDSLSSQLLSKDDKRAPTTLSNIQKELLVMDGMIAKYAQDLIPFPEENTVVDIKDIVRDAIRENQLDDYLKIDRARLKSCPLKIYKMSMTSVVREMLRNVFFHAYKKEETIDVKKVIIFSEENDHKKCIFSIVDFGNGINQENMEMDIFAPGWKSDSNSKGAGMGLTYAKYVVEEIHHGSIRALPTIANLPDFIKDSLSSNKDSLNSGERGLTIRIELPTNME
jgi:signal transduction histidine kinase